MEEKGKLGGEILIIATWHNKKRNFSSPPQLKIELSPSKGETISLFHFPSLRASSFLLVVGSSNSIWFYLLNVECWRNFESGLDITKYFFFLKCPNGDRVLNSQLTWATNQLELGKNATYLTERLKATDNRAREVREKKEKKTICDDDDDFFLSLTRARLWVGKWKRKKKQNLTATSHHARETTPESIMKIYTLLLELEPELIFAIA